LRHHYDPVEFLSIPLFSSILKHKPQNQKVLGFKKKWDAPWTASHKYLYADVKRWLNGDKPIDPISSCPGISGW